MKNSIILFLMLGGLFMTGCKKMKMKNFPTIIEISASQLDPNTNVDDLQLIFGAPEKFNTYTVDKQYDGYNSSYFGQYFESIEGDKWNDHSIENAWHEGAITKKGDKFLIKIYWDHLHSFNEGEMKPWKKVIKFILVNEELGNASPDFLYDNLTPQVLMKKEGEIDVELKPKRIYNWDLNSNTLEETGEKPNKTKTYYDENGSTTPSSPTSCLVGQWRVEICTGYYQKMIINENNTGKAIVEDCTGQCEAVNEFTWSTSAGRIYYEFTKSYGCGVTVTPPANTSNTYECGSSTVNFNGNTFYKF